MSNSRGRFHKLFWALRPTFEKLYKGVEPALRRAPNFNRAISMICTLRPTFMKSTPGFSGSKPFLFFEGSAVVFWLLSDFRQLNFRSRQILLNYAKYRKPKQGETCKQLECCLDYQRLDYHDDHALLK